jgi:hypothetical protein
MKPPWTFLTILACGFPVALLAATVLGAHWGYGYFIDELYYIACAHRLDFGYVDHPPLSVALLRVDMALFGDGLVALRFPSAAAAALTAFLAGLLAARLGGGRYAQGLAAVSVGCAPLLVVLFGFYSMNAFEILLWTALLATVVEIVLRRDPRLWLLFGAISGVALQNKHTVVVLAAAVVAGLALTPQRKLLFSRWLLAGGGLAFLIFLPNLLWQIEHGFPSLEFYRNATLLKNRPLPPLHVLWNQVLFMNPATLLVWGSGLLLAIAKRKELRFLPWTYGSLLATLVVSGSSRPDRMAGIYPALFGTGAVALESALRSRRSRALLTASVAALGAAFVPIALPVLPPALVSRYVAFLGIDTQVERGEGKRAELPQWLADRFGWEELVRDVAEVVRSLPEEERDGATILAPSYGHAGALELFGRGLPPVLSPHNTYHLWGRDEVSRLADGVAVSLGYDGEDLAPVYESVVEVGRHRCEFCMTWRNDVAIYVARGPKLDARALSSLWQRIQNFE